MTNILFAARHERWPDYEQPLRDSLAELGLKADLRTDFPPEEVDYIIYAPNSAVTDFTPFTRLKAVMNLWAGVEAVVNNPTLTVPLIRMVDPALTQGMVEWVTGHTLRHHLGMDTHIHAKPGEWISQAPPVAWERKVTVLGLGELGRACAESLARIGFQVTGWSQGPKAIDGLRCLHGAEGLTEALSGAQIVVLLLPDTPQTENTLNGKTLALLAKHAVILNPGRGPLIDDDVLLAALDSDQIGHATLDTFRVEPLPAEHPYWHHPKVTVTPHIASETRAAWSSKTIAENIRRGQAGEPFLYLVDRTRGY